MTKESTTILLNIPNKHGDKLNSTLRYPKEPGKRLPVVIFCHGFKGFKDWGCFPYILESFAESGFYSLGFNFSYNGTGPNHETEQEFTRLELFEKNTISRELDDLKSIIDYIENNEDIYNYDVNKICLIGHSRGGADVIITASEDKRIKKLITLAAVDKLNYFSERILAEWKEKGFTEFENTRTKQMMRMSYDYVLDLEKNKDRFDLIEAIKKIKIPTLIIHGTEDLSVKYSAAENLYNATDKKNTKLELYEGTGHTFGSEHPFKRTFTVLENVIYNIVNFLQKDF